MAKFRKFTTSTGSEALLGKNASNNDELIKKFKGKDNIILHTSKPGSPFAVTDSSNKKDIKEIAIAVAVKSQDWRDNQKDVKVHQFNGTDVYKKPNMKIGTWGVKGKPKVIKVKKQEIKKFEKDNK